MKNKKINLNLLTIITIQMIDKKEILWKIKIDQII